MRFGISLLGSEPDTLVETAVTAEGCGFDSVWLGEHVIVPRQFASQYPYSNLGDQSLLAEMPFYDPYAALSFVAARTTTLLLGLGVAIVPLHDPYHLARSVATLDRFSGGRLLWGIGAGWLAEEFEILGREWRDRGARMEEALEVMVRLWNDPVPAYSGRFYRLPPAGLEPKPLTRPHPPFIFGGSSPVALRRAARLGDGWFGVGLTATAGAEVAGRLRSLRAELGRADDRFEVTLALSGVPDGRDIVALEAAGVARIVLRPAGLEGVRGLARELGRSG